MSTGSLFKTKRLERAKFEQFKKEVFSILTKNNVEFFSPYYYDDKETFGDLDIIVKKPFGREEIFSMFRFNKTQYNVNSNVHSICYHEFQIDFITTSPDKFEMTKSYYAWADISILIGRLFKKLDSTFGWDGLSYTHETKIGSHYRNIGDIFLSDNMEKILGFLKLDYQRFKLGFKTQAEAFEFISTARFFNPKYFIPSEASKKAGKRQDVMEGLVDYSSKLDKTYPSLSVYTKDDINVMIDEYFNGVDFLNRAKKIIEREKIIVANADKFNGDIVMKITGLKNKELGDFIVSFKKSVYENYGFSDFNEYVYTTKPTSIIKDIELYYKLSK